MKIDKTILIVEDENTLLDALEKKFTHTGFTVITAQNGEEGLDIAQAQSPDLILLDIVMPKMDGITMLRQLRKNPETLNIPVILLTNLSFGQKIQEALEHGVTEFLIKSNWSIAEVVQKVKDTLSVK